MSSKNPFRSGASTSSANLQRILSGEEYVCSFSGTSQYGIGGTSACGIAAMNCVRIILALERVEKVGDGAILRMLQKETMREIIDICAYWTSNTHLEIEEIYNTPLFEGSLNLVCSDFGKPGVAKFDEMLRQLDHLVKTSAPPQSHAVVITRPPEIIVCLKIVHPINDIYVVFDSHSRPKHPDGSAFIFNISREEIASYLASLLQFDAGLLDADSGLQWQAQLLGNVSGHFFECSRTDLSMSSDAFGVLLEANFEILRLKGQENETKAQVTLLSKENARLTRELERMDDEKRLRDRKRDAREGKERQQKRRDANESSSWRQIVPNRGVISAPSTYLNDKPASMFRLVESQTTPKGTLASSSPRNQAHTRLLLGSSSKGKGNGRESDLDIARRMQVEYYEEEMLLRRQYRQLQNKVVQAKFECNICMDEQPLDCVASVDSCGHRFCRDCIRQYITSKLEEHRFPIVCPSCVVQSDRKTPGQINEDLIQQIGIDPKPYSIFIELEMANVSVLMHCRSCGRGAFVDKGEYDEAKILTCPFPGCLYLWCKDCQRAIPLDHEGPPHSCDGSSELKHLMVQRGWKHCPGCKTPTEKIEGCNHMTCESPGCNAHFCYVCGKLIVQSALRTEIKEAVEDHYRRECALFDVPPDN